MSADRYTIVRGVGVASADALALILYEVHRFAAPLARCQTAAAVLWSLPEAAFGWEVARAMAADYTGGFCDECGCGFRTYLFCERNCSWRPAEIKPDVEWTTDVEVALHRQALARDTPPASSPWKVPE